MDRFSSAFPNWSSYHYANNNPISYIDFNGNSILFDITASGGQLRKRSSDGIRLYYGGIEFKDGVPQFLSHSEGRYNFLNNQHEYVIGDHLGNNVVMFTDANTDGKITDEDHATETDPSEVLQRNFYYSFGMVQYGHNEAEVIGEIPAIGLDPKNNYLYNGKELHEDEGLDWSNYGARFYDPSIGRFTSIDPLTEKFAHQSGYVYADNDPIGKIDFMGMNGEKIVNPYDKALNPIEHKAINDALRNLELTSPMVYKYLDNHKSDFIFKFDSNIGNNLKGVTLQDIRLKRTDKMPKLGVDKVLKDSNGEPFGAKYSKTIINAIGLFEIIQISDVEAEQIFTFQYVEDSSVDILLNPNNLNSQADINSTVKHESGHAFWNMMNPFKLWMWSKIGQNTGHDVHNPSGKVADEIEIQ